MVEHVVRQGLGDIALALLPEGDDGSPGFDKTLQGGGRKERATGGIEQ